ncbi:hypothetical protein AB0N71_17615 [Pseudarthrobacter enclensis]|uniref:hypothetical protein n=1 Tax=Pseudarthrobacter enclensis TaxID=993070 RepID=UPI00343C892C
MENPSDTGSLDPGPRHLRRRRGLGRLYDEKNQGSADRTRLSGAGAKATRADISGPAQSEIAYGRKRLVASIIVIFVVITVPALVLALLLLG